MLETDTFWELVDRFMAMIQRESAFPVIIFDTEGRIIRATDQSRIGDVHAGAVQIMQSLTDGYAVTPEEAARDPLVREGYSCPIVIDGQILAGFGISGKLELTRPLARIAVQMIQAWIEKLEYQKRLERSARQYRHLFDNALYGVYQATSDGRYLKANAALAEMLGYASPDALMTEITDIASQVYVHPENRHALLASLAADGHAQAYGVQVKRRDGQVIDIIIHSRMARDPETGATCIEGYVEDITAKKMADEALRLSEEKYFKAFNNCPVLVVLSALETGRYIEVNETFLRTMGFARGDIVGRTSLEVGAWEDPEERSKIVAMLKSRKPVDNIEIKRRTKSGRRLTMLFSAEVIDISGEACMLSVAQDISGRKQMEEKLRLSENNLRITLDSIGDAVITTDTDGLITRMNPTAEQLTGWRIREAAGRPLPDVFQIVNANTREKVPNPVARVLDSGEIVGLANHTVLIARDGREYQIADSGAPIRGAGGRMEGVVLAFRDITEAYTQAERIRESEKRLKSITANLPGVVYHFHATRDHQYSVRYVSEKMPTYFGIDAITEGMFETFIAGVPDADKAAFLGSIREAVDRERNWQYEGRFIKPSGEDIWFRGSAICQPEEDGLSFYGTLTDITERKAWEHTLSASERRYKELFNDAPVMYVITENRNEEPYILNANTLFLKMLGYRLEEVIDTPLARYYSEGSKRDLLDGGGYRRALQGVFGTAERCLVTRDGKHLSTLLHALPEQDEEGSIRGTRAMFLDITARKQVEQEARRLEAALAQAQKMEAIGTLAGGIAHDFNNILSAVIGFSQLSFMELDHHPRLKHNLEQILAAGMRARDLVGQILAFSRQQERKLIPVKVGPLIKEVLKMLRATIPTSIDMVQDIASDMDSVMADPTQIQQIVLNLCTNAAQAMDERGGQLTVTVSQVELDADAANRFPELKPGSHIKLDIQDTGEGIPEDVRGNIFHPYFTTKEIGRGTGLGLSVVHGIVQSYNGVIDVASQPGRGTRFTVYIPVAQQPAADDKPQAEDLPTGNERILLVDDEPLLVEIGKKMLEMLGYEVIACQDAVDALNVFRKDPDAIDLVISDVTMPKMTGDALAKALLEIDQRLPIILCTGFSDKLSEAGAAAIGVKEFLMKPVVVKELAHKVRQALMPSPPAATNGDKTPPVR